jgi:hypothetical protein
VKESKFESELALLDDLMQRDLKKKERKRVAERLRKLIGRVDKYANRGSVPKEAALRIRIDLLTLIQHLKNDELNTESSRKGLHDLAQQIFSMYRSLPKSRRGESPEDDLMTWLFKSFK